MTFDVLFLELTFVIDIEGGVRVKHGNGMAEVEKRVKRRKEGKMQNRW